MDIFTAVTPNGKETEIGKVMTDGDPQASKFVEIPDQYIGLLSSMNRGQRREWYKKEGRKLLKK